MIDMRDKPWHEYEVKRAAPDDLICDMDVAALGVSSFGKHLGPPIISGWPEWRYRILTRVLGGSVRFSAVKN